MKKLIPLLAATFLALSSFAQDQHKKDSLFTALKTAKEDTNKVRLLVQYGYTLESQSRDSLIYYLRKALELSKKIDYKKATIICCRNIAQYHESNSLTDSAIFYTMMWLTTAKELNDSIWIGKAFLNLSYLERNISNANLPLGSKKGMMYLDSAISYANNDKVILREAFSRKSEIYTEQKKFDDAKYFLQQAIKITPETDMDLNLSVNLAYILIETGRADSAVTIFSSLLERDKRKPFLDIRSKSYLYAMIANAYIKLKNYKLAVENGETGLKLAIDNHLTKERLDNLDMLYQIYAAKNDYEKALYYFKQHRDYSDSLSAYTSKSSDANFQNQLKAERNQQQIIVLEKDNEKQKLVRNGFIAGFVLMLLFVGLVFTQRNKIKKGKKLSDELLLNILPSEMAEELKANGTTKAKAFTMVTVMFTDFKDFTTVSEKVSAELLVAEIHHCFSAFDRIIQKYKIEKIKTIGDSYMCASGLPVSNYTHAKDMVNAAFEIRNFMLERKKEKEANDEIPFELRIGIHTGPVVAGIVGIKKFAYDIWGDTVNLAARMEQNSEAGKINISGSTYELVKDKFNCTHRGKIQAKNKGEIDMYFVEAVS